MPSPATTVTAGDTAVGCPEDPAAYPVLRDVQARYADLAPDGRVGVVALARWFEDSRVGVDLPAFRTLVQDGGVGPVRVLLANQRVEVLDDMPADGRYRVGIGIRRLGRSSFTYGYGVFRDEWCVAVGDTATVYATSAGPTDLPDALRGDLAALCLDETGPTGAVRPPAERHDPAGYDHGTTVVARYGDIDTNRHGNNVALLGWYADAVAAWHSERLGRPVGGPPPGLAVTRWSLQYVAEVTYPGTYDLRLSVGEDPAAGEYHYRAGLFAGDRCVGLADGTGPRGSGS